jgi:hypothetical protein
MTGELTARCGLVELVRKKNVCLVGQNVTEPIMSFDRDSWPYMSVA